MIKLIINHTKSLVKTGSFLVMMLSFIGVTSAQGWERTLGANSEDYGEAVIATSDWGAVVAGYSESFGSDNDLDVYVVRLDIDGNVLWSKIHDEGFEEHAYDVLETSDGGFLVVGDIIDQPGQKANGYLLKIDANGERVWSYQYGSPDSVETLYSITSAVDNGFMLVGSVAASEGEAKDMWVLKVTAEGELLWSKSYGGELNDEAVNIAPYKGGYVVAGSTDNPNEAVGRNIFLYRLQADGETIWSKSIGDNFYNEEAEGLLVTQDDEIVLAGLSTTDALRAYIAKFDENGEERWSRQISSGLEAAFRAVVELPDGSLVAAGLTSRNEVNIDFLLVKLDADGQVLWLNNQGREETFEAAEDIAATQDGGFLLAGFNGKVSGLFNDLVVVKTDGLGNTFSGTISGKIFFDRDGLCDEDINDDPIEGWLVKVESPNNIYFGTSDADGHYQIAVDTGAYQVSVLLPTNLWKTCISSGYDISFNNLYDTAELDFPVSVEQECPYLEVNVSALTPLLCIEDDYFIEYRNSGTSPAQNARVELTVDESFTVTSASAPYEMINGKLVFSVGNLLPFQGGKIQLTVSSCDEEEVQEQEALMVKAEIFSDVFCANAGPEWDGSTVIVTGECTQDSISFIISNEGQGDMTEERSYGVVEDLVWFRGGNFKLKAGEFINVFRERANGSTFRIIAEQVKDHPGMLFPTFALEGCATEEDPSFTTGFVTMFPENDQDPNVSIDVQEVVFGPLPEVEMKASPKGYEDQKLIGTTTDLTYKISFHNAGSETIRRVVIRDTLPAELDITSVLPGTSSHPYTFEIYNEGILKITFSDIALLPGGGSASSSSGFVNFKVSQKPGNPVGTIIENSAAVFLGYHRPVQSNTVFHEVGNFPDFLTVSVEGNKTFVPGVKINVSPNPFIESTVFTIEEMDYKELTFSLYDLQGRLIRKERHNSSQFEVYRNDLTGGMYFYTISSREQIISTGKLLVQ